MLPVEKIEGAQNFRRAPASASTPQVLFMSKGENDAFLLKYCYNVVILVESIFIPHFIRKYCDSVAVFYAVVGFF